MTKYTSAYNGFTIEINPENDKKLTKFAKVRLRDGYTVGEETIQEAFARAACAFADDSDHAQRLYRYVAEFQWFMFATPLLSNGGLERGLPISCFLNAVGDSRKEIADHLTENMFLSTNGGGIGSDWSDVRSVGEPTSRGSESTGVISFMYTAYALMLAANQGVTRRGSNAFYLDISHPEVEEFIRTRRKGGIDIRMFRNGHIALNIPDAFMVAVEADGDWDLVDPHSGRVAKTIKAKELWKEILKERKENGEPFIHWIDRSNAALPQSLKDKGLAVRSSNLCTEILLPTSPDRTAVCCLSSVNVEKFDEWEHDSVFIEDMMRMLDNALETFINKAPPEMHKAVFSAKSERSVGLGVMGLHSYYQRKGFPCDTISASSANARIFSHIADKAREASMALAIERGEPADMAGTGLRFAHNLAIAPNASSSIFLDVSPGIEPLDCNYFVQKTLSGSHRVKNKYLAKILKKEYKLSGDDLDEAWRHIAIHEGSVQGLKWMHDYHKSMFKTAAEVDQVTLVDQAATRQPFICQGQSLNLFVPSKVGLKYVHEMHIRAWKLGLKTLYYLHSSAATRASEIKTVEDGACVACEG